MKHPNIAERQLMLSLEQVSKKFPKNIKSNIFYGLVDMIKTLFHQTLELHKIRDQEFWALKAIDFELHSGDVLALVGKNGCGKTTLLRLISGIYPIDAGKLTWQLTAPKITALFALQSGLRPMFSGLENIFLKGAMLGMTKEEITQKLDYIEELAGLGDKLELHLGSYSAGMRAKLVLSVTLATDPDVFIIDEGLVFSDATFQKKVYERLQSFVRQPNKAIIIATHQFENMEEFANKIVLLDKGKVTLTSNNVQEVIANYLNT